RKGNIDVVGKHFSIVLLKSIDVLCFLPIVDFAKSSISKFFKELPEIHFGIPKMNRANKPLEDFQIRSDQVGNPRLLHLENNGRTIMKNCLVCLADASRS